MDPGVQHAAKQLRNDYAYPRQPNGQGVGPKDEHRAYHIGLQRDTDASRVGPHQVALQLRRLRGVDPDVREIAEAGRHAVDRSALGDHAFDH